MPRSGTSLIEQIISNHSEVHGAGELDLLPISVKNSNWQNSDDFEKTLNKIRKEYLEKKKSFFSSNSNNELVNWLRSQKTDVILISRGDPLWFGIGRLLLENFSKDELSFYPSNTCIQLAFSKLKIPWQDTVNVSIHGRDSTKLVEALKIYLK